jgi:hypothetical protein
MRKEIGTEMSVSSNGGGGWSHLWKRIRCKGYGRRKKKKKELVLLKGSGLDQMFTPLISNAFSFIMHACWKERLLSESEGCFWGILKTLRLAHMAYLTSHLFSPTITKAFHPRSSVLVLTIPILVF